MLSRLRFRREHRFTVRHAPGYAGGELDRAGRARVHAHAGRCPMCRDLVRSLVATVTALASLRELPPRDPVADRVLERLRAEWRSP